jgi:hypothetical protein
MDRFRELNKLVKDPINYYLGPRKEKLKAFFEKAGSESTTEKYASFIIPAVVFTVLIIMFLVYWFWRGNTEESQKTADSVFSGIVALLGVGFAISGIYSVPYLTRDALKRTSAKYAKAYSEVYDKEE